MTTNFGLNFNSCNKCKKEKLIRIRGCAKLNIQNSNARVDQGITPWVNKVATSREEN
jgi:hypothetical protein